MRSEIHELAMNGELEKLKELLNATGSGGQPGVNAYDAEGFTPLMRALASPQAGLELVRLLIDAGADVRQETRHDSLNVNVMAVALSAGDPAKVTLLLERGADLRYRRAGGYHALLDAVHGRDVLADPNLLELLRLLIRQGADLNGISEYGESGLRVLSRVGRHDTVRLLLEAGADAAQLKWSPLHWAVAAGSLADLQAEIDRGGSLEEKDHWARTPWLLAIDLGDIAKARLLLERGADQAARGRCGKPPLFYPIENRQMPMLQWLLKLGVEERDEFGATPLMKAVNHDNLDAVRTLIEAGADVHAEQVPGDGRTALSEARSREIALLLLDAGADPGQLPFEARRALLGFPPEPDESALDVSPTEFRVWSSPRFGRANPEEIHSPFWEAMIRAGVNAYVGRQQFQDEGPDVARPGWCAQRFGQSITFLPDGRIVQIGGEHEDYYDSDFCIYNDVFVHQADGSIRVFGYPSEVFPPTDFHTATLIGDFIYIVGSLRYAGTRTFGKTPVFRLDTRSFAMAEVFPTGEAPGWIYQHRATLEGAARLRIAGGIIVRQVNDQETHEENTRSWFLATEHLAWISEPAHG